MGKTTAWEIETKSAIYTHERDVENLSYKEVPLPQPRLYITLAEFHLISFNDIFLTLFSLCEPTVTDRS